MASHSIRFVFIILLAVFAALLPSPAQGATIEQDKEQSPTVQNINKEEEESTTTSAQVSTNENNTTQLPTQGISFHSLWRGVIGIVALLLIAVLFSKNRRNINWRLVGIGLICQIAIAAAVLYVPFVESIFEFFGKGIIKILSFTKEGSVFLFGQLADRETVGSMFVFQALPAIIFFSALISLLYYLNVMQRVVWLIAWCLKKILPVSGPEGLVSAGNIFLGQSEAALLIKKYLPNMNRSEIFLVMTAGMATISGSLIFVYSGMLGGASAAETMLFSKHLIAASVMAAPASIVFAKLLVPQTEQVNEVLQVPAHSAGKNWLEAISNGTSEGVKIAVIVAAQLLVFIALIALVNYLLGLAGRVGGLNEWISASSNGQFSQLSLQYVLGLIFTPIAWLMGINSNDIMLAGNLLGEKIALNEFIAYIDLVSLKQSFAEQKTAIMATYFLCGFANIGTIGMQIGVIGGMAPTKREWITQYGLLSVLGGTLVSCMSATIVGMMMG